MLIRVIVYLEKIERSLFLFASLCVGASVLVGWKFHESVLFLYVTT